MAEQIISPGVFTRENDLSFLPAGIGAIGAAIIGPTQKGPAFVPTVITRGFSEYGARFGSSTDASPTYVPLTVRNYLRNAGTVTVVRVLGGGGYKFTGSGDVVAFANTGSNEVLTVLHPSKNTSTLTLNQTTATPNTLTGVSISTTLTLSGSGFSTPTIQRVGFNVTDHYYIEKMLGTSPENTKTGAGAYASASAYCYVNFKQRHIQTSSLALQKVNLGAMTWTSSNAEGYDHATTPWIQSGLAAGVAATQKDLFKFHTIADGNVTNKEYKIVIDGIKMPADVDGIAQYSTFNVKLRKFGDKDKAPRILEQFNNVNLDPNSPNYIAKAVGDRYANWDNTLQKVMIYGNYPNKSQFIRIEMDATVDAGSVSPNLAPKGFAAVYDTIKDSTYHLPPVRYRTVESMNNPTASAATYNTKAYLGWDFEIDQDHKAWNLPVPDGAVTNKAGHFNLDNLVGHANAAWNGSLSASIDVLGVSGPQSHQLKYAVPFQGGFDGVSPAKIKLTGNKIVASNMQGLNMTSTATSGYTAYKKALDILSNQDEYDFNLLALPGVINELHSGVTDAATTMVEDRGDAFYVMDLAQLEASVVTAVNQASGLDSNYAGVYYPWVKVLDTSTNRPVFVPPSVVVPGAIAQSDAAAAEWFAPAGLNRGVLGNVLEAKMRLNQTERDSLYEGKVNPIATFPRTGVCIWGQKTLQTRSTALDRINVRRLLIEVKKFIASSSKYLVFEQNTLQTRNRFLNIVNPYLESVQQRQGLFAFRVQMDESNNTPDVVDRNQLIGAIYLQPTKTAEFIILDFNVLPTGATFDA